MFGLQVYFEGGVSCLCCPWMWRVKERGGIKDDLKCFGFSSWKQGVAIDRDLDSYGQLLLLLNVAFFFFLHTWMSK